MLRALLTAWLAFTLVFFGLRLLGRDGIAAQYELAGLSTEQLEQRRAALGLSRPLPEQYTDFLLNSLRGNLGQSFYSPLSVTELIALRFPSSLGLALSAMLCALPLSFFLAFSADHPSWGRLARLIMALGLSLPIYWTGTLLIFSLGTWLGGITRNPWLAALLLGWHVSVGLAQVIRAQHQQLITSSFWQAARARGLGLLRLELHHALPHLALAVLPLLGNQWAFLLSGAIITEALFLRPGLGTLLLDAVLQRDYPVVQGIVIVLALWVSIIQAFANSLLLWLDPRLRWP